MTHYLTSDGLLLGTAERDDPHEPPRYSVRLPQSEVDAIFTALARAGLARAGNVLERSDTGTEEGAVLLVHARLAGDTRCVSLPSAHDTLLSELAARVLRHVPPPYQRSLESLFPHG